MLTVPLKQEAANRYVLTKTLFGQFLAISGPFYKAFESAFYAQMLKNQARNKSWG